MSLKLPDPTPEEVRKILLKRRADPVDLARFDAAMSRRKFLGFPAALGGAAALSGLFGRGMIPVAWSSDQRGTQEVPGKTGMTVHVPHPVNGEFAPHLLDDDVTPTNRHFVRNNGGIPERASKSDLSGWKLKVDGEVDTSLELTLDDLKKMPSVTLALLIECGGNGRALFDPSVRGNPWGLGAIGCSKWTGVRLRDVLRRAGVKGTAKYTAHYGEDSPLGAAKPFSRGVPIEKAMEEHTLVAYQMNGQALHPLNGFPVRLVVPGWVGSCSQKWLTRIWVRDKVHDSQKMGGYSYRIPAYPVTPGTRPPESDMVIATSWVIKSMITRPAAGSKSAVGKELGVAGHAWAGESKVRKVLVSTDYGIRWKEAKLSEPPNKYAWYRWETDVSFPGKGYYEVWARAFDDKGNAQPFRQPWNPKGYLGNVIHRLPVHVGV